MSDVSKEFMTKLLLINKQRILTGEIAILLAEIYIMIISGVIFPILRWTYV